jgi:hypothetical protein
MTHIKQFVSQTTADLRGGRQSWRVLGALWTVALTIAIVTAAVPH